MSFLVLQSKFPDSTPPSSGLAESGENFKSSYIGRPAQSEPHHPLVLDPLSLLPPVPVEGLGAVNVIAISLEVDIALLHRDDMRGLLKGASNFVHSKIVKLIRELVTGTLSG